MLDRALSFDEAREYDPQCDSMAFGALASGAERSMRTKKTETLFELYAHQAHAEEPGKSQPRPAANSPREAIAACDR